MMVARSDWLTEIETHFDDGRHELRTDEIAWLIEEIKRLRNQIAGMTHGDEEALEQATALVQQWFGIQMPAARSASE